MRENKRKLEFRKIKIAKMNTLNGGGETDTIFVLTDNCPSGTPDCPPYPGSDIHNPCSDTCLITFQTCPPPDTNTGFSGRP